MAEAPTKKSRFFAKIPKSVFLRPEGMIILFLACFLELSDWIFDIFHFIYPGTWENFVSPIKTMLDLSFAFFSALLLKVSILSNLFPFLIERVPILSTILPTWVLRLIL